MLYYTHHRKRTLTVNINLIWTAAGKLIAYNKAITLFMEAEVIEQRNAFEYVVKRISFIYFADKRPVA